MMFEKDWSYEELVNNTWEQTVSKDSEEEEILFGSPEAEAFEAEFWGR